MATNKDKLTRQMVIDDVRNIVRPVRKTEAGNKGQALLRAMLARANAGKPTAPPGRQPQQLGQIPRPPTTPPIRPTQ